MMRFSWAASLLAALLLAVPTKAVKKPQLPKLTKLDTAVYLASEFDAATTYHLLHTCGNGCYEANPMLRPLARNSGVFVMLGAGAFAVNYFAHRLENESHPRWGKALRVMAIGVHTFAGAHAIAGEP